MPSRLANLIPEPPEKQTIGLRHLLDREFGSHLFIIVRALVIAKPVVADETKSASPTPERNIPHLQITPHIIINILLLTDNGFISNK